MKSSNRLTVLHNPFGQLGTDPGQRVKIPVRRPIQIEESLVDRFGAAAVDP